MNRSGIRRSLEIFRENGNGSGRTGREGKVFPENFFSLLVPEDHSDRLRLFHGHGGTQQEDRFAVFRPAEFDGGKWIIAMKAFGFVKVPPEADTLVLLIGTNLKPNETAWYDNPCVSLITPEDLP